MAIRTIQYTVDSDMHITPAAGQAAGVQGDCHATEVVFRIPAALAAYALCLEIEDNLGGFDSTPELTPVQDEDGTYTVATELPFSWTKGGGTLLLRLAAVRQEENSTEPEEVIYSYPARLLLADHLPLQQIIDETAFGKA